ncbi:MAG: hypothetical protein COT34_00840 [Candidatus Nealsonbacteria bacterium CG08_land_8_20_14_0_20_43_11]|uniref:3D domain-containing protein n=1 Tax=Candidatus Nealsonbacteria bacterium CG08_land_8_20_14_0_20_43_11 TaxID=1974706 RepID=A0A2M6T165_9BACT|nr:MAG: hypothetical protein COT34_00840 [Candidatus Nealsonbacteria bacterium CG08_land_8_20_14_0_20_43_11]
MSTIKKFPGLLGKNLLILIMTFGLTTGFLLFSQFSASDAKTLVFVPAEILKDEKIPTVSPAEKIAELEGKLSFIGENSLVAIPHPFNPAPPVKETARVTVTAYSSTIWQTDESPFLTASGAVVYDGIVAANFLPFKTKIRIPEVYGERIFVVEDRMHSSRNRNVDIWFPDYQSARNFGVKRTYIEVLED